ncbi:hypothetical protein D9M70_495640 [compost metagenome]
MKDHVGLGVGGGIPVLDSLALALHLLCQILDLGGGGALGGVAGSHAVHRFAHGIGVQKLRQVCGCDPDTAARLVDHQPVALEHPQGFAQRRTADSEFGGDPLLAQRRARRIDAGIDAFAKCLSYFVKKARLASPFEGLVHRSLPISR